MFGGGADEQGGPAGRQVTFQLYDKTIQGSLATVSGKKAEFLGAVAILRDVTLIHQVERTKENFITTLSHELRTPLTALKGYIELLLSGVGGPLAEEQQNFVQVIRRNADRMVDLVNSFIFVAQMQEGRAAPTHGHADLRQIINQVARENGPAAQEGQITLQTDLAGEGLVIQADPVQLHLVIEKLLNNGIKYTPAGGEVTIAAKIEPPAGLAEERYAVVSVRDSGIGIPPEQQSRIFEQFFRSEGRPSDVVSGGMGIGLSIVKTLVEAHGGRVWVESDVGQGSSFSFIIPVERRGSLPWLLQHAEGLLHRAAG